ncbi:multidrug resistance-associated protein 1 [Elysia marginata]|uniref:Multidrug resistance-associated protein 1 n=1 Tax=Elysia marginata TaxID=1093978 RepID=A0AAV4F0Y8_9GAST|nr:multidrug resistance-associated protein 1 [Elysia marginata]
MWYIYSQPIFVFRFLSKIGIAVYLLWITIGLPVVSGLALLVLLVPCNVLMAYYQGRLQRQNLEWKDKRIKMTSEVLSGIKVLKLYAWEESFQSRIMEIRHQEVLVLTKLAWINAFGIFLWTCAPYLVCLVSFATYVIIYPAEVLTADMAFVTLALFNILQFPISFIPEMVSFTSQAAVSLKRIGKYLCEAELNLRDTKASPANRGNLLAIDIVI